MLPNREAAVRQAAAAWNGLDYSAGSLRANFARRIPACAFWSAGRRRFALAGISESCARGAERRRISSRQPGLSRRPRAQLAARPEADCRGRVRRLHGGRTSRGCRAIPFPLLSESSIAELQRYEEFIRQPIEAVVTLAPPTVPSVAFNVMWRLCKRALDSFRRDTGQSLSGSFGRNP